MKAVGIGARVQRAAVPACQIQRQRQAKPRAWPRYLRWGTKERLLQLVLLDPQARSTAVVNAQLNVGARNLETDPERKFAMLYRIANQGVDGQTEISRPRAHHADRRSRRGNGVVVIAVGTIRRYSAL